VTRFSGSLVISVEHRLLQQISHMSAAQLVTDSATFAGALHQTSQAQLGRSASPAPWSPIAPAAYAAAYGEWSNMWATAAACPAARAAATASGASATVASRAAA